MAGGFSFLERGGSFAGYDQGLDFTGTGTVYAPVGGTVTNVRPWHFLEGTGETITFQLDPNVSAPYHTLYFSEAINPSAKIGTHYAAGSTLGQFSSGYPGIEIGWADTAGEPVYSIASGSVGGRSLADWLSNLTGEPPPPTTPTTAQRICPPQCSDAGFKNSPDCQNCRISSSVTGGIQQTAGDVGKVAHDVAAPFEAAGSALASVEKALGFIFSLRFLEIIFGGMLVMLGIYLVVRQMGQEIGIKLPGPVAAVNARIPG